MKNLLNNNQRPTKQNSLLCGLLLLFAALLPVNTFAQDDEGKFSVEASADVVTSYIWRGQKLDGFAFQPTATIYAGNFYAGVWSNIGKDCKELDIYVGYEFGNAWVEVMDYWLPQGSHAFEGTIGYDFGPVNLSWATIFAGDDGVNKNDKRAYSSYICANVPFSLLTIDWAVEAGAVPWATDYYEDVNGFAVVDLSLAAARSFNLGILDLGATAKFTYNPAINKTYLVGGINIYF